MSLISRCWGSKESNLRGANMPKEYEYDEGPKARENFEEGMKALFQVPKDAVPSKKKISKKKRKLTEQKKSK